MILPVTQAIRFFNLFDALTVYAHSRLHVVSDAEFYTGDDPSGVSEVGQRKTCAELWEHPELVEDFVRENPLQLSKQDLTIVESWQQAYTSVFFVDWLPGSDDEIVFSLSDYACVVSGLSKHLDKMLPSLPTIVQTTLLPFGDKVVYAMFMISHFIEMGENMVDMFQKEMASNVAAGRVVRTGAQFLEVVPNVKQQRMERELEQLHYDIEMEERAQGPLPGQHRGVLANMSEEERERTIRDAMAEALPAETMRERVHETIDKVCLSGEPVFTLKELEARRANKGDGYDMFVVEGEGDLQDVSLVADPVVLESLLVGMSKAMFTLLRQMVQNGGQLRMSRDGVASFSQVPSPTQGLVYYFHDGDDYVAVMPNEVLLAARQLNWDEVEAYANEREQLLFFMEMVVELRGMVRLEDAIDEYRRMYPNCFADPYEIGDLLFEALDTIQFAACMFDAPDCTYLVHYEMMWEHWRDQGIDYREGGSFDEGELSKPMRWLLDRQRGKEPRRVTQEMVSSGSVISWACEQPPALGMRDFLDAHVPDDCDDCFFSDAVIEDLLTEVFWGQSSSRTNEFFYILEDHGFVPDESQVNLLLQLWMNMCNGLPNWPNNGWAPNELLGRTSGRRLFFNEDGSMMKVGRNDPCPCGSGKKYKRCCGRN